MWLKNLFKRKAVCEHSWVEDYRYTANVYEHGHKKEELPILTRLTIVLKCRKCGEVKFVRTTL